MIRERQAGTASQRDCLVNLSVVTICLPADFDIHIVTCDLIRGDAKITLIRIEEWNGCHMNKSRFVGTNVKLYEGEQHFHNRSCYSNNRMLVPARISVDLRIKNVGLYQLKVDVGTLNTVKSYFS